MDTIAEAALADGFYVAYTDGSCKGRLGPVVTTVQVAVGWMVICSIANLLVSLKRCYCR